MSNFYGFHPNRTLCGVLEEIRDLDKVKNYSGLLSLIEEVQVMGNRMEAALEDNKDIRNASEYISELKKEIKELQKQKGELDEQRTN